MWILLRNRRDMEPPDECVQKSRLWLVDLDPNIAMDMLLASRLQNSKLLRLRGAGDPNPNQDSKFNEIPYLSKMNFTWNGLPCIDFDEKILNILNNGLGSMNIKGGTLLQTVRRTDPGGLNGNPPRAAATPSICWRLMMLCTCLQRM